LFWTSSNCHHFQGNSAVGGTTQGSFRIVPRWSDFRQMVFPERDRLNELIQINTIDLRQWSGCYKETRETTDQQVCKPCVRIWYLFFCRTPHFSTRTTRNSPNLVSRCLYYRGFMPRVSHHILYKRKRLLVFDGLMVHNGSTIWTDEKQRWQESEKRREE
jgi:hypothetical protein